MILLASVRGIVQADYSVCDHTIFILLLTIRILLLILLSLSPLMKEKEFVLMRDPHIEMMWVNKVSDESNHMVKREEH